MSGPDVVMAVTLRDGAERAQGVPRDSVLVIHLNQYPRPSLTVAPGAPAELLGDLVMERFLFDRHRANELGAKLAAVVEEKRPGISSVDRRRLDDGARALAAIEPPQTDVGALRDYVEQLAAAVAAMQSLDDLGSRPTKGLSDLLALQEKWKDAERKLTALRPLRVLESPHARERVAMGPGERERSRTTPRRTSSRG